MAIEKVKDKRKVTDKKSGKVKTVVRERWRYRDRSGGLTRYFDTKPEAQEYQEETRSQKRRTGLGLPTTVKDRQRHFARDIVLSYLHNRPLDEDELDRPEKELRQKLREINFVPPNAQDVLVSFSLNPAINCNLHAFNEQVAQRYVDVRSQDNRKTHNAKSEPKKISAATVIWEVSKLGEAWKWARKTYPDLISLENPWEKVKLPSVPPPRDRELVEDEAERLLQACTGCLGRNKYYLPLGILLASETGMRRQEFIDYLFWEDVDLERRRITVRKSKTDRATGKKNQQIVLPLRSWLSLKSLATGLGIAGQPLAGKVFPMTGEAFSDAFDAACKRAKPPIEDLHLHDLRQTATTFFMQAKLFPEERQIMKRESPKTVDAKHYQGKVGRTILLERIQNKLDIHQLGVPWTEVERVFKGFMPQVGADKAMAEVEKRYPGHLARFKALMFGLVLGDIEEIISGKPSIQPRLAEEVA